MREILAQDAHVCRGSCTEKDTNEGHDGGFFCHAVFIGV